jgi:hypothetical protein
MLFLLLIEKEIRKRKELAFILSWQTSSVGNAMLGFSGC